MWEFQRASKSNRCNVGFRKEEYRSLVGLYLVFFVVCYRFICFVYKVFFESVSLVTC